jgi:hypothetical protein
LYFVVEHLRIGERAGKCSTGVKCVENRQCLAVETAAYLSCHRTNRFRE